ncbi:LOW QUALITY PROTEIN: uncharacterized protein LOC108949836 [Ciona intestinalis]
MDIDYRNHNPVPNEGFYEQEIHYNPKQNYEEMTIPNKVVKEGPGVKNNGKNFSPKFWKLLSGLVFLLVLTVATVGIYYIANSNATKSGESCPSSKPATIATSCLDLKNSGVSSDGYYFIQPTGTDTSFKVYCDMTTSGGGWTLVASVHENDINGKCTNGDTWFSNNLARYSIFSRNWENTNTFGNVKEATSADYKNIGYSAMKVCYANNLIHLFYYCIELTTVCIIQYKVIYNFKSTYEWFISSHLRTLLLNKLHDSFSFAFDRHNLMLRHVPNKTPVDKSKLLASLQYHTSNNFLNKHGGNLFTTYTRHYPMNPKTTCENSLKITYPPNINKLVDAIAALTTNLTSGIPDFYKYTYGTTTYRLQNGGIFTNYGMEIRGITISKKSHPFIVVTAIENPDLYTSGSYKIYYIWLQITSYRPSYDLVTSYNGKLTEGNFELQYRARCVYGRNVPSVCDVVFAVNNTKVRFLIFKYLTVFYIIFFWGDNCIKKYDWASSTTITLSESTSTNSYSYLYSYTVSIKKYPKRIMFGYTMLSRTGGRLVTKVQMESTLRKMLQPFKNYTWSDTQIIWYDNSSLNLHFLVACSSSHLVVPVTYTIGESTLTNFVPPSMHFATTTGFLQIRAESYTGTYYAMCPAVKLNNCDGQYVCIGGVKNGYSQTNDCNDLTDWNGLTTYPDYHTSKSYAHSTKDIESTIMIFYR